MLVACVAMLLIALLECAVFNLPFWTTLSASADSSAAENTLGPGLERTDDGLLRVTDPTRAWLEVKADGSSPYARVDTVDVSHGAWLTQQDRLTWTFHLRVDANGRAGRVQQTAYASRRSAYIRTDGASGMLRIWVQERQGALLPIRAVRANVHVAFAWSWPRVAALACVAALMLLCRPGSRLWRTRLDPADPLQRRWLALTLAPFAALSLGVVVWQAAVAGPLVFHNTNGYTYDYDQYAHVADALLHGHAWLDLPVPHELAQAANPHAIATRERLMADGVSPIYWDYAFFDGHWYSYFGVVPAVLLFLPYQAVTSLWVDGGLRLPSAAADVLFMFGFLAFACLLTVRLVHRLSPRASLGSATMACAMLLLGSNACYLWFRTNFYSVPIAASMMFTCLGLWLWMGAIRPSRAVAAVESDDGDVAAADDPTIAADWSGAAPLSLPHLAGGAACIAANFGCRPPFVLSALLAFPLFWPQITGLASAVMRDRSRLRFPALLRTLRAPLAIIVPALIVVVPLMAYNAARFGSILDFGSAYQMTVTDMTNFRLPAADIPYMIIYYLFLPLRFSHAFPFLSIQPTPLPEWGFTEAMVGGLFTLCPLLLLALLLPRIRRRLPQPYRATALFALALGLAIVVVDVVEGGLGWRYMADFGWLICLAAMPVLMRLLEGPRVFDPLDPEELEEAEYPRTSLWRRAIRLLVLLVMLYALAVTVASCFVPGRDDSLDHNAPAVFYEVRSWFTMLGLS
ncbi:hypothetical protein DSM100688_1372 [Bifidobacterium ramosum]|uniref:Glycosyltransferase n=1 Tax=Bifidobacterium ramosum TaxID=1798158 RepID=A0A6L4WZY5_9BIFI|nr:hypothetical protein [Bifidobacterium ramosum]KAB8287586.1 hypothetical protein DSM100688_1372 [Bifidobacterium ramosum]NEG72604.1 hypothetical protein [Bifidobacterium ramosum]